MESRIVPVLPYGIVNYSAGLIHLSYAAMAIGTLVGPAAWVSDRKLRRRIARYDADQAALRKAYTCADPDAAQANVVLGGDGFMLATLHAMLDAANPSPCSG